MPQVPPKQTLLPRGNPSEALYALHRKTYLQPFERELARREVSGLGFEMVVENERAGVYMVKFVTGHHKPPIQRLTYFDLCNLHPTIQAARERSIAATTSSSPSLPKRRVLRFGPHDFHEYRGKFFPQLVRSICNAASLDPGALVLDPMCGSGTTIVEARALDMVALGLDRNPLSVLISDVKSTAIGWDLDTIRDVRRAISRVVSSPFVTKESLWNEADEAYLRSWFASEALLEIAGLLGAIEHIDDSAYRGFARVCLSDILRTVSEQNEEDLRVRRARKRYREHEAVRLFQNKAEGNVDALERLVRVDSGHDTQHRVILGDARSLESYFAPERGKVDAVLTSPPYAMALPYLDTDRLSLVVLGLAPRKEHRRVELDMVGTREVSEKQRQAAWEEFERQRDKLPGGVTQLIDQLAMTYHGGSVGFRRRNLPALLGKYFLDMRRVLCGIHTMLGKEAPAYIVVGNNSTRVNGERVEIQTDRLVTDLAEMVGFTVQERLDMELLVSRDIFRKNRGSREQMIHLVKG